VRGPAAVADADSTAELVLGRRLLHGFQAVVRGQHPSGEMLSFRRDPQGNYAYLRSPFLSTFVHDALACFDPTSAGWLDGSLALLPERSHGDFARTVASLRRRIRSFLIWQQEASGYWRFFGRGSGIDPDVNSTACASLSLLEGYGVRSLARWERQQAVILALRSPAGPFYTFLKPRHGGYGWLSDDGLPVVGFDRVVNAEVLRFLVRLGRPEAAELAEWLLGEATAPDADVGSPLYPTPIAFAYVLGRALQEPGVPAGERLGEALLRLVLGRQQPDGGFGAPLSTAMGATAMLGLGYRGPRLAAARLAVLRGRGPEDAWPYEDFVIHGFGAPAWSTALSIAFLARHRCATGEAAP
jgi:hypothetical protein